MLLLALCTFPAYFTFNSAARLQPQRKVCSDMMKHHDQLATLSEVGAQDHRIHTMDSMKGVRKAMPVHSRVHKTCAPGLKTLLQQETQHMTRPSLVSTEKPKIWQ